MQQWLGWALLAMLCYGIAPVFEKEGLTRIDPTTAVMFRGFLVGFILLIYQLASGHGQLIREVSPSGLALVLLGSVFGVLLAQTFYFQALRQGSVGQVVPVTGAWPLVAVLLAVLLFHEPLSWPRAAGSVLVVAGLLLLR